MIPRSKIQFEHDIEFDNYGLKRYSISATTIIRDKAWRVKQVWPVLELSEDEMRDFLHKRLEEIETGSTFNNKQGAETNARNPGEEADG